MTLAAAAKRLTAEWPRFLTRPFETFEEGHNRLRSLTDILGRGNKRIVEVVNEHSDRLSGTAASGAPSSTPTDLLLLYHDTATDDIYISTGTGSSADWQKITNVDDKGYPRNYIGGLTLSNDTDTDHDIAIAVGACRDSGDSKNIELTTIITKQIDASWAAGDDAGGLFSGSVANDTWYHVFIIEKDSDGSIDAGFDTSLTAANIPAGYTAYRRIGSVLSDGSANILQFHQRGDCFTWVAPYEDFDVANAGDSDTTVALAHIPTGVEVEAWLNVVIGHAATVRFVYFYHPDSTSLKPSVTATPSASITSRSSGGAAASQVQVWTDVSAQISYRANAASTELQASVLGWRDKLGRW